VWWSGDITLSILYLVPSDRGVWSDAQFGCFFGYGKRARVIPTAGMDMLLGGGNPAPSLSLWI